MDRALTHARRAVGSTSARSAPCNAPSLRAGRSRWRGVLGRQVHAVPVGARLGPRRHAGAGRALRQAARAAHGRSCSRRWPPWFGPSVSCLRVEVEGAPSPEAARLDAALALLRRPRTRWDEVLLEEAP